MVFGDTKALLAERFQRPGTIQPGRGNKAADGSTGRIFQRPSPVPQPLRGVGPAQAKEFTFAGGQVTRLEGIAGSPMALIVAMDPTMQHHLDACIRPLPQLLA